jgi:TatD DNase family protein
MSKHKHVRPEPETLGLPLTGVDSHAHMDLEDFDADREALLDRARACGVARIGNVFLGPAAYHAHKGYFERRPDVFFLLGIHPCNASDCTPEALEDMRRAFAADPRLKAVGEIGLDFYWDDQPHDLQEDALRRQLRLALKIGRPPVIHSRDAFDATVRVLREEGLPGKKLLWHCFNGDELQARTLLDQGWHLSIPGPVSYAKNESLQRAVTMIPLDRLLIETDSPYLTPEPWRGKRNHPALVGFTAQTVAWIKRMPVEELWASAGETAREFFALEEP